MTKYTDTDGFHYVVVTGGRDYKDKQEVRRGLHCLDDVYKLFVGDCPTGVDKFALEWAEYNDIPHKVFEADWSNNGKAAGPIRNREMLLSAVEDAEDAGGADKVLLVAFPGGRGTANCCDTAERMGIKVVKFG